MNGRTRRTALAILFALASSCLVLQTETAQSNKTYAHDWATPGNGATETGDFIQPGAFPNARYCAHCHEQAYVEWRQALHSNSDEYGAKKGTFASHRWLAGHTAVPYYYGFDKQLHKTIEFLKSGMYLNVDLFGIKTGDGPMAAPLGSTDVRLKPNETVQVMVVIQNKNMFAAQDASGRELYHSGFLTADGMLDTHAHSFTNRSVNSEGSFVDNHKVWTIHSVAYDNTIQSGRSALVRYEFRIPADAKGPLTFTAKVNYRHFRQTYLNNVFGPDHPAYPVVELVSRTRTLQFGENPAGGRDADDAICRFVRQEDGRRELSIQVRRVTDPGKALSRCRSKTLLRGIGNEAFACETKRKGKLSTEQIVGRVRDHAFVIKASASDPSVSPEALREAARRAAEQVSGNLF